jgi:hypothetical protein
MRCSALKGKQSHPLLIYGCRCRSSQLGRDSSNSSQPPSQDGPASNPPGCVRGRSGRRPGGQKGPAERVWRSTFVINRVVTRSNVSLPFLPLDISHPNSASTKC